MNTLGMLCNFCLTSVACCMIATCLPTPVRSADVPQLPVESYRLSNGLKVALSADPTAPQTTICVTYHVGSKNERLGLTGFAHFFEHMMFRGTKNIPNFDKPLQEAGGSPNAFTSTDVTVYFETVPSNYLERALFMEAERMAFLDSALDLNKFDTEREIVKNERRQRMENVPYGLADETIASYLFPKGHPYSWSVIGSMNDLNNADLGDLRQFFIEFYHPGNATLAVVGNFDIESAKIWIERYYGALRSGPEIKVVEADDPSPVSRLVSQLDQVQFPRVYWAWPTVPQTNADAPALELLATILADGDASRLQQALMIDKTLASEVSASSDTQEIAGMFSIDAIVAPGKTTDEVEQAIQSELEKIRSTPPSEKEVVRAQRKYQKEMLEFLTDTTGRAFAIGMGLAQFDNPHRYQVEYRDRSNVTPEDIQRVAATYLRQDKVVLHILPTPEGEEESPAVLAGPLPTDAPAVASVDRNPSSEVEWSNLPGSGAEQEYVPPSFETYRLSNGLNVWVSQWNTLPLVSVQLVVPVGSAGAPGERAGLANLTARLWEKGTLELTSTEFAAMLDGLGTTLSVGAGRDTTELSFTVVKDSLLEALALVGSMVSQPRFDQDDFDREQALVLSDLASGPDNPQWIASRVLPGLIYGRENPYGLPVSGYASTVKEFTRDQVQEFYENHFAPKDATLIVVGDVDADKLVAQLEQTWGKWDGSSTRSLRGKPEPMDERSTVYVIDKPGAVQSVLSLGRIWRDRRDPGYSATQIGNRVLGGDFLSRLNQNLRERNGYTYGARSGFRYRQDGGEWTVGTNVRADVTGAALKEIMTELKAAGNDRPLSDSEIDIARAAELNTFPSQFESPGQIAEVLASLARYQLPSDYLQGVTQRLRSAENQEIARLLSELANPEAQAVLVVGDRGEVEKQLKDAGFDQLTFLDVDGKPLD